ncbi:MAG: ornithine cyclodeaminase family protein [Paracoccaceae bacterium]|nr:ornithine cyclodeaminase family protein [Paracoccaceae bacterium]
MLIVPEALIAGLVTPEDAFAAVEATFAAMARNDAYNFPVIREALGEGRQYGFKSGLDRAGNIMGVKAGGYFPGNAARGMINHQSSVFLFDPETGLPTAMVGGNLLTALRTAAASAISIDRLARKGAKVLGIVGAGHQAGFQLRAAARIRKFDKVVAWNYHPDMLPKLGEIAAELGLPFEAVSLEQLGAAADVIITITSSPAASLLDKHVRPGTHLACMGTDTIGKQEVEPALLARARVFTDEVAQSVSIGEAQHAIAGGLIKAENITPIGAVIAGLAKGRQSDTEITLFDGTGVGLQDLAVASAAVERAVAQGVAIDVKV